MAATGPPCPNLALRLTSSAMPSFAQHLGEVDAALAAARRAGIGHRLGGEQRRLELLGRRDVGLGRALAHHRADAGARQHGLAAGHDLALLDQVVDAAAGDDDQVGLLALGDALGDASGGIGGDDELVLARLLEQRLDVRHGGLDGAAGQHAQLGSLCIHSDGPCQRGGDDRGCATHDVLPGRCAADWTPIRRRFQSPAAGLRCRACACYKGQPSRQARQD